MDPLDHFVRHGAPAGLKPNKEFDTVFYLAEHSHIYAKSINPLVHYIEYGRSQNVKTTAVNEVQTFDAFDRALRSGLFAAAPTAEQVTSVSFGISGTASSPSELPLPPLELAQRVGSPTLSNFEIVGASLASTIRRLIEPFSFDGARCMDFGCGAGRSIRHFAAEAESAEIWGCDIDGTSIYWLSEHLSPPFHFFQLGDAPLLPFEDNSFDLICAIGVFCQVFRDWQLWALELRRILKPGGCLIMTYNGQGVFETTFPHGTAFESFMADRGMYVIGPYYSWNQGGPQVIHSTAWVQKMWGGFFDIEYIACNGLMDYQDICVMRKPARSGRSTAGATAPVHKLGTSQAFHPDAVGRIYGMHDERRPYLESYGIEAVRGHLDISGWIVFKQDVPLNAQIFIGELEILGEVGFAHEASQKNWDADRYRFTIRADASSAPPGRNTISVHIASKGGITHVLSMPIMLT